MAGKLKKKKKKRASISLRNFTGKVTRNPNGTVTVVGRGTKKKRR